MLSNLIGQLKQANAMDKYYDVLAEVPRVRKDFGYPPLVTPTSQIVGTQAVMNVISRRALQDGHQGVQGAAARRVRQAARCRSTKKCAKSASATTRSSPTVLPTIFRPELDKYREEIRDYYQQEEDVLSYALFPQVAIKFFQYRQAKQLGVDSTMLNKEEKVMPV